MNWFHTLTVLNIAIVAVMTAAYLYQVLYTALGFLRRRVRPAAPCASPHRFAALISARNEQDVIGELIASLRVQNYPAELLDIYVLADNCTDHTVAAARRAGANVYIRSDTARVGKGYALDDLLGRIRADRGENAYDAFLIFDADNIVDPNFVREMDKTFSTGKYDAITCYRNSKNFGDNWITAGYSIWFLREARFLNYPRMLLGTNCAVSGTGFLVSNRIITENGGWPFHLLTEDIQFSVDCAVSGRRIGYCDAAIVYDEQPTSFSQSWNQRLRWSKGFFQVDRHYMLPLLRGALCKKGRRLTCYDMLMTIAPCMFLTFGLLLVNLLILLVCLTQPRHLALLLMQEALRFVCFGLVNYYFGMFAYGALTVFTEWKRIPATTAQKLQYLAVFPLFMATYIPIALAALLRKVEWTQIRHYSSAQLQPSPAKR